MKRIAALLLSAVFMTAQAQTARQFKVDLTPDGEASLAAYLPSNPTGRAVVDCPGGGYTHLSMNNEGHDWASWFNDQGIAFFVLTYRMPHGDRQIPISDATRALSTVRDSAASWGVNPRDVGIMGFSAGGHLASTVSAHGDPAARPDFTILFYPVISMNEDESHSGSVNAFLGNDKTNSLIVDYYSNHLAVCPRLTPPAIILLANDDRAVPPQTNGMVYHDAMLKNHNNSTLYTYPSGGHGFGFRSNFKYHDQMLSDLSAWLRKLQVRD